VQVEEFLERSAVRFPGQTALVCGDRRLTYAQVEERCNRMAHALIGEGVQPGDRVAIHLDNSVEAVLSVFAILKAGAVFLVVNATTKADKLAYILNNCRATALITDSRKLDAIEEGSARTPHLRTVFVAGGTASGRPENGLRSIALDAVLQGTDRPGQPPAKRRIDIDLAALIYTSSRRRRRSRPTSRACPTTSCCACCLSPSTTASTRS